MKDYLMKVGAASLIGFIIGGSVVTTTLGVKLLKDFVDILD